MLRLLFAFAILIATACAHTSPPTTAAVAPQVRTTPPGQYFHSLIDMRKNPNAPDRSHFYVDNSGTVYQCPVVAACYQKLEKPSPRKAERCVDYSRCGLVEESSHLLNIPINMDCALRVQARTDKMCEQGQEACDRAEVWNRHALGECGSRGTFDPNWQPAPSASPASSCGTSCATSP